MFKNRIVNIIAILISIFILCSIIPTSAFAQAPAEIVLSENEIIEYYSDGSYSITTVTVLSELKASDNISATKSPTSGSKSTTHYSSSGEKLVSLTVYGSFTYNCSSAAAKSVSYNYTIHNSSWSFSSGSASTGGATASATGKFKHLLFLTKMLNVSLTCSANGSLY